MRLFWIFLSLAVLFLIPFLVWGEAVEATFTQAGTVAWLRDHGTWAWAAGMGLLAVDLVLPLPATVVMAALGYLYGPVAGGLVAAAGSFLAGSIAYWLCRRVGRGAALRIVGEKDLAQGEALFARLGGPVVAVSRWLPLLPEVIACMAGLARMPATAFHAALLCGALPLGATFAYLGHAGREAPVLALVVSALAPLLLWLVARPLLRRREHAS